jgi:magnesium chelatase family protein
MSVAKTRGCVLLAVSAHLVEVESHIANGLVGMQVTGLADTSINESRDRVRSAIQNTGLEFPQKRITIGLSPAALPKNGSALDLPIAVSLLAAAHPNLSYFADFLNQTAWFGELALDGRVRPVRGALLATILAAEQGLKRIVVPSAQLEEAKLVQGIEVIGAGSLASALNLLGWELSDDFPVIELDEMVFPSAPNTLDMKDVKGQSAAKFALSVAAAGGHHLAMLGSPGVGKTLLASRLPGILPKLDLDQALETTAIASLSEPLTRLVEVPPFAAPHHTASYAAMIGGGTSIPQPGLVTRAHNGVLFLDEAPEFSSNVLDGLRQPLEAGEVEVNRRTFSIKLPASFQLVLAANPCPCGYALDPRGTCTCTPAQRRKYLGKISGPLLDRIDIRILVHPPAPHELAEEISESSTEIRARVENARNRARRRLSETIWKTNAAVPGPRLRDQFPLKSNAAKYLNHLSQSQRISPRGLDRVSQLAWTIADFADRPDPSEADVSTAVNLRDAGGQWPI